MNTFDATDERILQYLDKKPATTSDVARAAKKSRTTILYRLQRLQRQGRVSVADTANNRAQLWKLSHSQIHKKDTVRVFRGHEFSKAYHYMLRAPKNASILAVQGHEEARYEFKNLPRSLLLEIHNTHRRKKWIIRAVTHKAFFHTLTTIDNEMLASHLRRSSVGSRLFRTGKYLRGPGMIISTSESIILSNPKKRFACVVREPVLVHIVHDALNLLFDSLAMHDEVDTYDFNGHIRSILEERAKSAGRAD